MQNFTHGITGYINEFRRQLVKTGVTEEVNGGYRYVGMVAVIAVAIIGYNSITEQMMAHSSTIWLKLISLGIVVYVLAYYNHRNESQLAVFDQKLTEANRKLEEASQKLEEQAIELQRTNQDIEQLAYIISHDLKAPVRNISSFMKLLSTRYAAALPPDGREFVSMSLTGAERLGKQIDDMLSYCRVNRNLPPATDVDLNETVRTISMELSNKMAEVNASIIVERGLPLMKEVHPAMIYQVFQHLLSNGIKFNHNPSPEVRIDYADDGDKVRFSVSDNGIGIANGFENKLFQMFKRLHTQEKYEGNGIGLAICKKIITLYKGGIWYTSTEGRGTTFYFTLPKHLVGPAMPRLTHFTISKTFVPAAA